MFLTPRSELDEYLKVGALSLTPVQPRHGHRMIKMAVKEGHILLCLLTTLPLDENLIPRGDPPPGQQTCWHLHEGLREACHEVIEKMRSESIGGYTPPHGFYHNELRRCTLCPSEYRTWIYKRAEGLVEQHPFTLYVERWMDLGDLGKTSSEEFQALITGQVCCDFTCMPKVTTEDHSEIVHDWSKIPSIRDRGEGYPLAKDFHVSEERGEGSPLAKDFHVEVWEERGKFLNWMGLFLVVIYIAIMFYWILG